MNSNTCWNCGLAGHYSENCPEPPKKSRCPSCNKVNGHTSDCRNQTFTSKPSFETTTVFQLQNTLKVEFQKVDGKFTVEDRNRKVPIGGIPLWLSTVDAYIAKIETRSLSFAMSKPMKRHVTFVNKAGEPVLSLVFFQKVLKLNSRFEINEKGCISFNVDDRNDITERVICKIGLIETEDVFKVRITWHGHRHVFNVHRFHGPILIDPLEPPRNEPQRPTNMPMLQQGSESENDVGAACLGYGDGVATEERKK